MATDGSGDPAASNEAKGKLRDALRDFNPDLRRAGGFGRTEPDRDPERRHFERPGDSVPSRIRREPRQPPFPEIPSADQITQQEVAASGPIFTFQVMDATETVDGVDVNKVLIADGKVKSDYPTGMPADDGYTIALDNPEDSIVYVGITFNPTTLAITSRFLGVSTSGDFPESRVESATDGFAYWRLARTFFDDDGNFQVRNVRVGDVEFEFCYLEGNGAPALIPVDSQPGLLDLDGLF